MLNAEAGSWLEGKPTRRQIEQAAKREEEYYELHKVEGVKVLRKEPLREDSFGHYWIEVGKKSYGWWPAGGASFVDWLKGVPGKLNAGLPYDPMHGDRKLWIGEYDVYVRGSIRHELQTEAYIKSEIGKVVKAYEARGLYGKGCDCRSFQISVLRRLDWVLVRTNEKTVLWAP